MQFCEWFFWGKINEYKIKGYLKQIVSKWMTPGFLSTRGWGQKGSTQGNADKLFLLGF